MSCKPLSRRIVALGFCLPAVAVLAIVAALIPSAGPARAGASALPRSAAVHQHAASAVTSQDWPAYLFSSHHPSATTGPATITLGTAGSLKAAWKFQEQPPTGNQPPGGFSASPTVADGMVFIGSQTGDMYALQESTGQVVWQRTDITRLEPAIVHDIARERGCDAATGILLMNPPYGERLDERDLIALYRAMAETCRRFEGWRAGFLVGNPLLERAFGDLGLRPRIKKPLANANLRAYFYLYDL